MPYTLHVSRIPDTEPSRLEQVLRDEGLQLVSVGTNRADVNGHPGEWDFALLDWVLRSHGYALEYDHEKHLADRVTYLAERYLLEFATGIEKRNLSVYMSEILEKSYTTITKTFKKVTGTTIEKHVIARRMELAVDMLTTTDLTLSEIAWKLGYGSVQHLSQQLRKETGKGVAAFRKPETK